MLVEKLVRAEPVVIPQRGQHVVTTDLIPRDHCLRLPSVNLWPSANCRAITARHRGGAAARLSCATCTAVRRTTSPYLATWSAGEPGVERLVLCAQMGEEKTTATTDGPPG